MTHLTKLLTLLLLACSGPATESAPSPAVAATAPKIAPATPTAAVAQSRSTLINIASLAKLPKSDKFAAVPGYPGKGFHMGVINDAMTFDALAKAGRLKSFAPIDWHRQMVVYLVLDAQTNSLDFSSWAVDGKGIGTLSVEWSGIEPFYQDATPAVIAVVDRNVANSINFVADHGQGAKKQMLGSIKLP